MLLQPQHFQMQDDINRQQLNHMADKLRPNQWGLKSLELNRHLLAKGIIEVRHCDIWFPNGMYIQYPGNASISAYTMKMPQLRQGQVSALYLVLDLPEPELSSDGFPQNSTDDVERGRKLEQFTVSRVPTKDVFHPAEVRDVFWAKYRLSLQVVENEAELDHRCSMKVMQLVAQGGGVHVDPNYIPPLLAVCYDQEMARLLANIQKRFLGFTEEVRRKARHLNAYGDLNGYHCAFYLPHLYAANTWLAQSICRPEYSCREVYVYLSQLLWFLRGMLMVDGLADRADPESHHLCPDYDHENLFGIFNTLYESMKQLTGQLTALDLNAIQLQKQGAYFVTLVDLPLDNLGQGMILCLSLDGQSNDEHSKSLKIGSVSRLKYLVSNCLSGVSYERLPDETASGFAAYGDLVFRIQCHGSEWQFIREHNSLALYMDSYRGLSAVTLLCGSDV